MSALRNPLFALALTGLLASLTQIDCTSSNSGSASGNPDGGSCPVSAPTPGTACYAAEGTTCSSYQGAETPGCYCCNGGFSQSFVCSKGTWQGVATAAGGIPNITQACPAIVPKQGSVCSSSCGGAQQSCNYDCVSGNGNVSTATCVNGSWNVAESAVGCIEDAGTDAADAAAD